MLYAIFFKSAMIWINIGECNSIYITEIVFHRENVIVVLCLAV